jgi:alpha-glucoside transport system substrate-binding protein
VASCGDGGDVAERTVVEVFGPIVGDPGQQLGAALRDVSADSPVDLRYVGVTSFNEQLEDRLASGDRPGVVLLPQPGLLAELTARGVLRPLPDGVMEASRSQYPSRLVDLVTVDDQPAAVWLTTDVKGLIWYRPAAFSERDLELPTTLDQLADLSEQIRATDDGVSPWCLTMEAGASTGWVGTDWVEDYAIRRLGSDSYDQWTEGELPFDSPMLTTVFEELDDLLRAPGAIAGGSRAVLNTPWEDSASLLLNQSATCLMAHQADFLRREMPDGTQIGPDGDIDFFLLPSADGASAPLLLGGTLAAPLSDDESVSAAMQLVASQALAEQLNQTPGFLSPHLGVDRATVPDATTRRLLDLLATTSDVRFDGSDLMPPAVGIGTFWTGMRAFFAGEDLDTLVAEIQAGWPATEAE